MDDHLASGQGGAPLGALELHDQIVKAHGIIPINGALVSLREDHLQIPVPARYKCRPSLCCRNLKLTVEFGDVGLVKKRVGPFQVRIPRSRNSWGSRPCQVEKLRSERPRACGE
jgi:hypothetical protein